MTARGCRLLVIVTCLAIGCPVGCTKAPTTPAVPRYEVSGRVVRQKKPLPWMLVTFHSHAPGETQRFHAGTDKDGHFHLEMPAGSYRVTLANLPRQHGEAPSPGDLGSVPSKSKPVSQSYAPDAAGIKADIPEGGRHDLVIDVP